mgnify:CR=1 FL=1
MHVRVARFEGIDTTNIDQILPYTANKMSSDWNADGTTDLPEHVHPAAGREEGVRRGHPFPAQHQQLGHLSLRRRRV